jgi:hypothetical protein
LKIKLGDVDLITRVDDGGSVKEIRSVANISVSGRRRIVELDIPGSSSSVFQDMGRNSLRISFDGELVGSNAKKTLQSLKSAFEQKKSVPFSSDITTLNDITEVVIESFTVNFMGGIPSGNRYSIVLREAKSSAVGRKSEDKGLLPSLVDAAEEYLEQQIKEISKEIKSGL